MLGDSRWTGLLLVLTGMVGCTDAPQLGKAPLDEVIAAMTLDEKIALLAGKSESPFNVGDDWQAPVMGRRPRNIPGSNGATFALERLGIPSLTMADGPAGVRIDPVREGVDGRTFYATAFPMATQLAASWDIDLVEQVGAAMGQETREYGADVLLAPGQNLHRFPLGGRNFEYYSEDPLLSGKMAAAAVRGVQSNGVGTAIKHYAVNNHEWNRSTINVKIDERALREIYLRGFEITVKEGQPWTVMSSYNQINGTYVSESEYLLTDILRTQWGFDGLVMTDWYAGKDPAAQMRAGNDLLMPGTEQQHQALLDAVHSGALNESILERNTRRMLELVMRTPAFGQYPYSNQPDLAGHARLARTAAAEGMVLLKNTAVVLPLSTETRIALFGNHSYEMIPGGMGSGKVNHAHTVSLPQGLADAGFRFDPHLADGYAAHLAELKANAPQRGRFQLFLEPEQMPEYHPETAMLEAAAEANDVAVFTLGRIAGEMYDRKIEGDFLLAPAEISLLEQVSRAFRAQGKPVVVILNIAGVIESARWRELADAILVAWHPGQEAGHAVADILSGRINPSGKLPDTFALALDDYPAADNFPGITLLGPDPEPKNMFAKFHDRAAEIEYRDGIWVGYRHFDTHDVNVAWPFGYGLSYTRFAHTDLKLDRDTVDDALTATITITNTGDVAGKEAVQLYIAAPSGGLEKPAAELRAFAKTGLLQPGQSQTLTFALNARDLASFDPDAQTWVATSGRYEVRIGASSRDIRQRAAFDKLRPTRIPL